MTTGGRFVKFCLVGIVNAGVNYAVFSALHVAGTHYLIASSTGFLTGVITSYAINRRWTFTCTSKANTTEAGRFLLVNLVALGVNAAVMYLAVEQWQWSVHIAWLAATAASVQVNFFGSQWWVFRRMPS